MTSIGEAGAAVSHDPHRWTARLRGTPTVARFLDVVPSARVVVEDTVTRRLTASPPSW
jgi:hypothetical protein